MYTAPWYKLASVFIFLARLGSGIATDVYCNGKIISTNELCCGDNVYERFQNSKEMGCCIRRGGSELYPVREKICCGEQLVPVPRRDNLECCNKELINTSEYSCCGGRDYGLKFMGNDLCCTHNGQSTLHPYKDRYSCCGTLEFHKDKEECDYTNGTYSVRTASHMRTCGAQVYDPADSVCCEKTGKVIKIPLENHHVHRYIEQPDWVCWNDELWDRNMYDYDEKAARVIPKGSHLCGTEIFYPNDTGFMCCGTSLLKISSPEYIKNLTCCGDQLLDLNDKALECCGNKFITPSMKGCCNGVPFDKGHDLDCCGREWMNKSTDVCCMIQSSLMVIKKKEHYTHTNCCKSVETGEIKTYNKYEQVCERGEIRNKSGHTNSAENSTVLSSHTVPQYLKRCPFCTQSVNSITCNKKYVYRFFVYNKYLTEKSTILQAVILEPYSMRSGKALNGEKVKIRTRNICRCFRLKRNFYLFTNRKIRSFKQDRYSVRFTADDVFIAQDQTDTLSKCLVYQQVNSFL